MYWVMKFLLKNCWVFQYSIQEKGSTYVSSNMGHFLISSWAKDDEL